MDDPRPIDREIVELFDAHTRLEPDTRFKPMGAYLNRHDADEAAAGMARQMPWTAWESCQDGIKFAIRRIS